MMKAVKSQGFTLIELMLVVVVMTTLMVYIVPNFIDFDRQESVNSVASDLVATLQQTHTLATGGVQPDGTFTSKYRFEFLHKETDPVNSYRGYYIKRIDENGVEISPAIDSLQYSCPVCIYSTMSNFDFKVPTGVVDNLSGTDFSFSVCYPGQGEYNITVNRAGGVVKGLFQEVGCQCSLNSCD